MLAETTVQDQVTIQSPGPVVNVRWANVITKNGEEISRQYHRKAYAEWDYDEFLAEVEGAAQYVVVMGWQPGKVAPDA